MLEPHTPEIRQELVAVRVAALRDASRPAHAGPVRRAVGNAFVRLGLLLGSDGSVPPVAQHESRQEAFAPAKASSFRSAGWLSVDGAAGPTLVATDVDLAWESAAPFGIKVGRRT
jgi:hypothetical protein